MRGEKITRALLLSAVLVGGSFLTACGGGGDDTTVNTGSGGGTGQTETYLAYSGSIYLLDPANPQNPITLPNTTVSNYEYETLFAVSSYDAQNRSYTDLHRHSLYWIDNGKVMMVSMIKGQGTPQPQQVSNISDACSFYYSEDDPINKKMYMVIRTKGVDGQCGTLDDGKVLIHNGMSNIDSPIDMTNREIITGIESSQGSGVTGFLVFENNQIKKCDTNLSNCSNNLLPQSVQSVSVAKWFASNPSNGNEYICVDRKLYVFDGNSLTDTQATCDPNWSVAYDSSGIYAVDVQGNILKLAHGGTGWTTLGSQATYIKLTGNYVIALTSTSLIAIPKSGGQGVTIESNASYILPGGVTANRVFYTKLSVSVQNNQPTYDWQACYWTEGDQQPTCTNNAYWAGFSWATNGTLNSSGGSFIPIYRMLKVEGATAGQYPTGGTLYAVDPANTSSMTMLGTVPDGFGIFGSGIGDHILLSGESQGNIDVFYANLSQQNSLIRITNTPNTNEYPLF